MKEMKLKNMILRVRVWDANEIPKLEILRARILECSIRVEANARDSHVPRAVPVPWIGE